MPFEYLREEARAARMGARLMAIVAEGDRGRVYLAPSPGVQEVALHAKPKWKPEVEISHWPGRTNVVEYGMTSFGDLFTQRQLVGLTTFSDLVKEARERVQRDALEADLPAGKPLCDSGTGAAAYADSLAVYLACVVDRMVYYGSSLTSWLPKDNALRDCMPRQALAMTWDFAEGNPLAKSSADVSTCAKAVWNYLDLAPVGPAARAIQADVQSGVPGIAGLVISTDPPYYANIGYADLSDFFYVWLRRSLQAVVPDLFATLAVPKAEELVASPYRHGGEERAEAFFLDGMTRAMHRLAEQAHPAFPVTIYYAYKQAESDSDEGTTNTGWDTFLAAVIEAGFAISGTWPLRTEGEGRMIAAGTNALASSIVLVCRPRAATAPNGTRREFVTALKDELPRALANLQRGNIAPVDLAQAAIGPGMAVYTRYARVLDVEGKALSVREALALINLTLDEALAEQEGDFDSDSRWALTWFDQSGFDEGPFGVANVLAQAKNTGMNGLVEAGIVASKGGHVRLLKPDELPSDWDPSADPRLTAWETVHQLIRALETGGEGTAAALVAKLGAKAEVARELCYRLYTLCDRKGRAEDARSYNGLVQSWPEIVRLATAKGAEAMQPTTPDLFADGEET